MMKMTTWRTWPGAAMALAAVVGLVTLAGCGGGGSTKAPTTLSLSGDHIQTTTLVAGMSELCGVVGDTKTEPALVKTTYFDGPYPDMHLLAAIVSGTERAKLLAGMETFERDALLPTLPPTSGADAAALYKLGAADLTRLRVKLASCPNA